MEKTKLKVNAKTFLEDFRSGKSDEELMNLHGLDRRSLNKLLRILVDRKLLDEAELLAGHSFGSAGNHVGRPLREPAVDRRVEAGPGAAILKSTDIDAARCPQCGAEVTKRVLTCPECGHVLPGEERWANVEPKKGFFDRVPPKLLGTILALPIAVVLVYVFRDMILPITEVKIDQGREAIRSELSKSKESIQAAKELAKKRGVRGVQATVERLIGEEILQGAESEYSTFFAGRRWAEISAQDKEMHLSEIRSAKRNANLDEEFDLVDAQGQRLARVTPSSINLGPFEDISDDTWSVGEKGKSEDAVGPGGGDNKDALRRMLERRLSPPGKSRKEP